MDLVSLCPFVASTVVWQANSGAFALTVIVKATFVLQPGTTSLASEQDPIFVHDRFYDEDPRRSVRFPSDVVPYKPRADVLLVGHAYAPDKQPVRSLVTRFVVGDMDKSIEVFCDRAFRVLDAQLLEGKRFTQLPLVWERASGGPESANPVGKRFDGPTDAYGTIAIANLQPPGHFVSKRSDTFVPMCYAPIAPTWPGRTQRLGRLSRSILDTAWNDKPLAADLDATFFQVAPPDQNVAEIRANERIVMENLHPEHAHLVTSLPDLRPRAIVDRATGEREEIALVGDTLFVDTDRGVCCVVWRGRIGLRSADEAGRISVTLDGGIAEAAEDLQVTLPPQRPDAQPDEDLAAMTMIGPFVSKASGPALPFAGGPKQSPGGEAIRKVADAALPFAQSKPAAGLPSNPLPATQPVAPPAIIPPAYVPPPAIAALPQTTPESVWASGAPTAAPAVVAPRETIGEAAAAAAIAAVAVPVLSADRATQDGALAASNAAAGAPAWTAPKRDARPIVVAEGERVRAEASAEMLQLLWFDPDSVPRIRRVTAWKKVLDALEHSPRARDLEIVDGAREPWELEDRQEVFEVLAKGLRTDAKGVEEALDGAIAEDGKFSSPLVLLAGELETPFDELEALKAAMSTATPLVTPADEQLKAAVNVAKEFIQVPGLVATPAVSDGLTSRIRDAFAKEKKALPPDYLDQQIERGLLANRSYQKREVFGGTYLRCLLWLPSEKAPLIAYIPADLAKKLPMWKRFRARIIAEVHPAQDQYETVARAVKVMAIGRVGGKRNA